MRFAAHTHPEIPPAKILEMATHYGARALGIDAEVGTLEPGKLANLVAVDLPEHDATDPHELLFSDELDIAAMWHRGGPGFMKGR
jgi:cytosine/adenosine deaminase-related metal-dependent hydrolase